VAFLFHYYQLLKHLFVKPLTAWAYGEHNILLGLLQN